MSGQLLRKNLTLINKNKQKIKNVAEQVSMEMAAVRYHTLSNSYKGDDRIVPTILMSTKQEVKLVKALTSQMSAANKALSEIKALNTRALSAGKSNNFKKKSSGRRRRRGIRIRKRLRAPGLLASTLSSNIVKVKKFEQWQNISIGTGDSFHRIQFEYATAPAWFKAISSLYEMFNLGKVNITIRPAGGLGISGNYIASYNTQANQKNAQRTWAQLSAQNGASNPTQIFKPSTVKIPASAFISRGTNQQTSDFWMFDFELMCQGVSEATSVAIGIGYTMTLYNPQLSSL